MDQFKNPNKGLPLCLTICLLLLSCHTSFSQGMLGKEAIEKELSQKNALIIEAAKSQSFRLKEDLYAPNALLVAEFHPLIDGPNKIAEYYTTIFSRQPLSDYTRETIEILELESRVIETGLFSKELRDGQSLRGKYMNVWIKGKDGLTLRGEAFGYLHNVEDPLPLVVQSIKDEAPPLLPKEGLSIPWELNAYNAWGESLVQKRDASLITLAYTKDGAYFPFADTLKRGRENLLKHFQAYYAPPATIDSIKTWTYDYDVVEDGYILYRKFYVDWTVPGYSGNTQGSGISYRRRLPDHSIRIHRQLGTHIHQE